MKTLLKLCVAVPLLAGLNACVTINVYFPAAAVEKAADRLIEEVYKIGRDQAPVSKPAEKK